MASRNTTTKRVTVRLAPQTHAALEQAARAEGIALAQYLREAAFMRLAWELGLQRIRENPQLQSDVRLALHDLGRILANAGEGDHG